MRRFLLAVLVMACSLSAYGRGQFFGYAQKGGNSVSTSGSISSNKVQLSYPGARVSVYLAGTSTLATLYSDSSGTAKANQFAAGTDGSFNFWTDTSTFDITFDQKGITTQCGSSYPGYPCILAFTWYGMTWNSSSGGSSSNVAAACDGLTDDTTVIQAALDLSSTTGAPAVLPAGTCMTNMLGLQSNVRLYGQGVGVTTLKLRASQYSPILYRKDRLSFYQAGSAACVGDCDKTGVGATAITASVPGMVGLTAYTNIEIAYLTFDGNVANQTGAVGATSWYDDLLLLFKFNGGHIHDFEIKNGRQGGLSLYVSNNFKIEKGSIHNNVVVGNSSNQIFTNLTPTYGSGACSADGWDTYGNNNVFDSLYIAQESGSGNLWMSQWGYGDVLTNSTLVGNGTSSAGVGLDGSAASKIINNTVKSGLIIAGASDCGGGGGVMHPHDNKIVGNVCLSCFNVNAGNFLRGSAIEVKENSATLVMGNTVRGGTCTGGSTDPLHTASTYCGAIAVHSDAPSTKPANRNLVISNNIEGQTSGTVNTGVALEQDSNTTVSGNGIGCYRDGVTVNASAYPIILGNTLFPTQTGVSGDHTMGIHHVGGSYGMLVSQNMFKAGFYSTFESDSRDAGNPSVNTTSHVASTFSGNIEDPSITATLNGGFGGFTYANLKAQVGSVYQSSAYGATAGTVEAREIIWQTNIASGQPSAELVSVPGTYGTLNGGLTTGSIGNNSASLTVSSATGILPGVYLTVAGATFNGGVFVKVTAVSGTTVTLLYPNTAAPVVGGAVAYNNPTLKPLANIP